MYLNKFIIPCLALLLGCSTANQEKIVTPENGSWRMEMTLEEGVILPFIFELDKKNESWHVTIINAEEKIDVDEIEQRKDSLFIQLPIFESEFILKIVDSQTLRGVWANYYKGDDYKIPVKATLENKRFPASLENSSVLNGKYAVAFSPNTEDEYAAIGVFEQNETHVQGTFATETGDYRHLEGVVSNDSLFLSTFDGSHAFLFQAQIKDSSLEGTFWSGTHYKSDWKGALNSNATLKDPDSLTFLKEGYDKIEFTFPNDKGEIISLANERFKDKAVIVQIMGSWCPNCLDETNYLTALYNTYNKDGLEIIALAFERTKSEEKAFENLKRLKTKTGAEYEFLLASSSKEGAQEKLPMLNHIMSYPTAIFIDKDQKIRRIHTGFYGPSTGKYYEDFVAETETLVQEMLSDS